MSTNNQPSIIEQITDFVESNAKLIAVVVVVAIAIAFGSNYYKSQLIEKQKVAFSESHSLNKELVKLIEKNEKQEDIDFDKVYGDIERKTLAFIEANKDQNAAIFTALSLSDLYVKHGKSDRAKKILSDLLNKLSPKELYYGLVQMNYATVLMEMDEFKEAKVALESIVGLQNQKHLHATALVKIGVCHYKLKDNEQAKKYFTRVIEEFSESQVSASAKSLLRWLNLNEG